VPWLIAHSEAENVLRSCAEQDPTGVWEAIQPYLSSPLNAEMFSIGFPSDILAKVPPADIKTWIAQQPEDRAPIVAQLAGTDLSDDATLSSIFLGEFGDNEKVGTAFFNKYISGPSWDRFLPAGISLLNRLTRSRVGLSSQSCAAGPKKVLIL